MDKEMKKNLEQVIVGIANEDSEGAKKAFHEYLRLKTQAILLGEEEDCKDEDMKKDDESDDKKDEKKEEKKDDSSDDKKEDKKDDKPAFLKDKGDKKDDKKDEKKEEKKDE